MYRLVASNRFRKHLKTFLRQHKELEPTVSKRLAMLQSDPSEPTLKTHKLTGKLKDCTACSITYEYRLVFSIKDNEIHLLAIGTHDEVY